MNNKKVKGLWVVALIAAMSLCACGKDDEGAVNTSGYEQTESVSTEESEESTSGVVEESSETDSSVAESSEIESTAVESAETNVEESGETSDAEESKAIEATETEEVESTKESTESSEESKESAEETKESVEESKESVAPSKESVAESTAPSKEPEPVQPAPTVEQPAPTVEQPPVVEVHTCSFGGGSVTTAATCTSEGVMTYTCSCGATKTESIGKSGHNYVTESQAASCTTAGYERTKCSTCGDVQSEKTVAAFGHNMVEEWFPGPPDCIYAGGMHFELCQNCGLRNELAPGAPLGHQADAGTVYRAGTCTRPSGLEHYCIRCPQKLPDSEGEIDPNNHDWGFDEEYQIWYCAGCGITK